MAKMNTVLSTAFGVLLLAVPALARTLPSQPFTTEELQAARRDPQAFTIDPRSITIKKIGTKTLSAAVPTPVLPSSRIGLPDLNDIINIGLKIWDIIQQNKPVVDITTQYGTAIPSGIAHWTDLAGWRPPQAETYEMTAKNLYGAKVVDIKYDVLRSYGGSYNGRGRYLTDVTIDPVQVSAGWGYKVSLAAHIPDSGIINSGTQQDPVAGMTVEASWSIATAVKAAAGKAVYYLDGNGLFMEIGGLPRGEMVERAQTALRGVHF